MILNEEERERNIEETKAKYKEAWWKSDKAEVLFLGQIQEPILLIDFSKFHKATEQALGRSVETHEFAEPEELLDEYYKERPKATMEDVLNKLKRYEKPLILMSTGANDK